MFVAMFGKTVKTPLFGVEVPVVAHRLAQIDKGSGIAMICTFGDVTDVIWWRELDLPNRAIIGWDGRIIDEAPEVITSARGKEVFAEIVATDADALERMTRILAERQDQLESHLAARAAKSDARAIEERTSALLGRVRDFFKMR